MISRLLPIGAMIALMRARSALRAGDLEAASRVCRGYLSSRIATQRLPLRRLDAYVVALAGACATLRGDKEEAKGAASLVEDEGGDCETRRAAEDVDWCKAARKGKVDRVLEHVPSTQGCAELRPLIVLVAAERGFDKITREQAVTVRNRLDPDLGSPEMRARSVLMLARLALLLGDRAEATKALARMPAVVSPRYRCLAAMARLEVDAAVEAAAALPPKERRATLELAATFTYGASSTVMRRVLETCGPQMSAAARATLTATLAIAMAREGSPGEALALLKEEQSRGLAATSIAVAGAYIALLDRDASGARAALRGASRSEALVSSLSLAALALDGDHAELAGELGSLVAPTPDRHQAVLRPLVLAALARGGAPPAALPDWLATPPEEPLDVYAWGLVRLQQGGADQAMEALDAAVEAQADSGLLGDARDVARLAVARARLSAGEVDEARSLAEEVKSPRLAAPSARLLALGLVKRRADEREVTLRADNLPSFVDKLCKEAQAGSEEAAQLETIRAELVLWRARNLLGEGKIAEARAAIEPLRSGSDPDVKMLSLAVDLCEGKAPLTEVEAALGKAMEDAPDHAGLRVLLAEVGSAVRGSDAGITMLESARGKLDSPLVEKALASAYQRVHRGLEAKRVGFAAAKRSRDGVRGALRSDLSRILALEVPPRPEGRARGKLGRKPARSALPDQGLSARVHVLFAHAADAGARDPRAKATIEAAVQRLKRSLMAEDHAEALAAEREIMSHIARTAT